MICGFSHTCPRAGVSRKLDLAVLLFKILDRLADQIDNLAVGGATFILRNEMELVMQLRINAQTHLHG